MAVPTKMTDLATLASSNSPAGTDAIGNSLDDYLRSHAAIIRSTNALASAPVAAATTTDIGAADGESVAITGSAAITSLGTVAAGLVREMRFASAGSVLTDSAAISLPAGDITVAAGDVFVFRSLGSGNWTLIGAKRSTAVPGAASITYAMIQNVSATDRLLGRSTAGAGVVEEIVCTAAGRALLDDANAAAQRTTLGIGTVATQNADNLLVSEKVQTVTAVASTSIDFVNGFGIILNQAVNITSLAFTTIPAGAVVVTIRRVKDASGTARTIAWPAAVKWSGGVAPTLTSTSGAVDIISLLTMDMGTTWAGVYSLDSR